MKSNNLIENHLNAFEIQYRSDGTVYLDGFLTILDITTTRISFQSINRKIEIRGTNLYICVFCRYEIIVKGKISGINFENQSE